MSLIILVLIGLLLGKGDCWGNKPEKVKLKDVSVLTLLADRMTSGRRSSAVPQLRCVGGSAGCHAFRPRIVQCYNRGYDGQDVQWECKTDMDNSYRFGEIQVSCEGYDYPEDDYILKGSCGLEYTLDLTKEGFQNNQHQHNYYGEDQNNYNNPSAHKKGNGNGFVANVLVLLALFALVYLIYKTCIGGTGHQGSPYPDDGQGGPPRSSWFGGSGGGYPPSAPPPPPSIF